MIELLPALLPLVLMLAALPVVISFGAKQRARRADSFVESTRRLGLEVHDLDGNTFRATGKVGGRPVSLEETSDGVELEVRTGDRIRVTRRGDVLEPAQRPQTTGDPAFDRVVQIDGAEDPADAAEWASGLDADTRRAIAGVVARGGTHEFGRWTARTTSGPSAGTLLDQLVRAADGAQRGDIVARLRDRAATDPVPEVRLLAADRLARAIERRKLSDPALLAALETELPSPWARVKVARLRGWAGLPTLQASLRHESPPVALEAALGFAELERGPAVEAALLAVLPHGDARVVEALARWGTVAAVLPLREWDAKHRRRDFLATDAIRVIQNRAVGAEVGQVTLAAVEPAAGSLTQPREAGRVSAARPKTPEG